MYPCDWIVFIILFIELLKVLNDGEMDQRILNIKLLLHIKVFKSILFHYLYSEAVVIFCFLFFFRMTFVYVNGSDTLNRLAESWRPLQQGHTELFLCSHLNDRPQFFCARVIVDNWSKRQFPKPCFLKKQFLI